MSHAFYAVSAEDSSGGKYSAQSATGGPWSAQLQHGGPPNALLVRAAERLGAAVAESDDLVAARLAAEFVGPVPVGDVEVVAQVVRSARSGVLVEVTMRAGDRVCLQGRVWLVRTRDTTAVVPAAGAPSDPPGDLPSIGADFPYGRAIEWQAVSGALGTPGPGLVWARPLLPIVAGETMSGLQRVALIGDSTSGISSVLSWDEWTFLNVDLDVHLSRPVQGEWVLLDARTTLGTHGAALARSTVSDRFGEVGATAQTLVLAPRVIPTG